MWVRSVLTVGLAAAWLTGCVMPRDSHVPDFARFSYEPFSRQSVVAIAVREWRLFGQPMVSDAMADVLEGYHPERVAGLWQRVGEYWWLGLDADWRARSRTGRHDEWGRPVQTGDETRLAWSAVFISYVMRVAGAGDRFPYSAAHFTYINQARRASLRQVPARLLWAEPIDAYAPQIGDLICFVRGPNDTVYFDTLPVARFASHCDIVVDRQPGRLSAIGGNVGDTVALKHVPTTPDGKLSGPGGALDKRYPWFVVLRVLYEH